MPLCFTPQLLLALSLSIVKEQTPVWRVLSAKWGNFDGGVIIGQNAGIDRVGVFKAVWLKSPRSCGVLPWRDRWYDLLFTGEFKGSGAALQSAFSQQLWQRLLHTTVLCRAVPCSDPDAACLSTAEWVGCGENGSPACKPVLLPPFLSPPHHHHLPQPTRWLIEIDWKNTWRYRHLELQKC